MGASGPHKGIQSPNVPWEIALACTSGDRVSHDLFVALHSTITLAGLYDLLELQEVQESWKEAALANAREGEGV